MGVCGHMGRRNDMYAGLLGADCRNDVGLTIIILASVNDSVKFAVSAHMKKAHEIPDIREIEVIHS